ncbi:MAG: alpha/beta hydrolase [Bacteroidota bacterium]
MKRLPLRILFLLFCSVLFLKTQTIVLRDSVYSPSINSFSPMTIILPEGYRQSKERFGSLYLLHGFNQDHSSWVNNSTLVETAKQYRSIIVCVNGKNSWYSNSVTQPELRYEDLLTKDIIPFIDKKYRTVPDKQHRSICGLSMGAYGALKYGLKYPALFGFAAGLSPSIQFPAGLEDLAIVARRSAASNASVRSAFGAVRNEQWNANDIFFLAKEAAADSLPYFYLAAGSQDNIPEVITQTHELAGIFRKKKIRFEMHESDGGHDWLFWEQNLQTVLQRITAAMK